jgi:hypothetical protein
MFFAVFGAVWLVIWRVQAKGTNVASLAIIIAATVLLFLASLRQFRVNKSSLAAEADSPESKRNGRMFNIVNAGQWILILVVVNVLNNIGRRDWDFTAVIFIVGAHFFPLAVLFRYRRHYYTGAAMVAVAVLYPLLAKDGAASPVGCLWAGLILWASSVSALLPDRSL